MSDTLVLRAILTELKAIRRLLEQDRGQPVMAVSPVRPRDPTPAKDERIAPRTRPVTAESELAARVEEEWRRGVPGHPDNEMGM